MPPGFILILTLTSKNVTHNGCALYGNGLIFGLNVQKFEFPGNHGSYTGCPVFNGII